jgi:NAD dependent epimerase/dehydratase family enzyme
MTPGATVGVLGATSLVGRPLRAGLVAGGSSVLACSRNPPVDSREAGVAWHRSKADLPAGMRVPGWISACPLWATGAAFDWLVASGLERLVALSSTSVFSKSASPDPAERALASRLAAAEEELVNLAAGAGTRLVILRPTMIYDGHSDGNVAAIAAWVNRWGWFPLAGSARGLRQPVHADDVAAACLAALGHPAPRPDYTLSGGKPLPFRDLVQRTCLAHGLSPRVVHLPGWAWRPLAAAGRFVGLAGGATAGMAARMNEDLVFDHSAATADLGFQPRPFAPSPRRLEPDGSPGHRPAAAKPVSQNG